MTDSRIHATAVISSGARLGADCEIGPHAVIEDQVIVGDRCSIAAGAVLKRFTEIGSDNRIGEYAVLGGLPQDLKFKDKVSYLRLGDRNTIRESVTLHRATAEGGETRIGSDTFLMAGCHVGHECHVGDHVIMANAALLAGHVQVGERAFLSGAAAVHQFCRIGRNTMVGGASAIRQDVLPFTMTNGNPSRTIGLNLIGLKRSGFSSADILSLKRALRLLFGPGLREERLRAVAAIDSPPVAELVRFIAGSKRGYCARRRRSGASESGAD